MGRDRKEKDRESKGRDRDTRNSDDERVDRKEKSKDRGRDRRRNRSKDRGRDRSRDRDRGQEKHREKRDGDRENKRKRSRDRKDEKDRSRDLRGHGHKHHHKIKERSSSASDDNAAQETKKPKVIDAAPSGEDVSITKTSGEVSLNIEETNKLRASLGLKPLQVEQGGENEASSLVTKEVHAPPSNIGSLQAAEKLREKLEIIREKRKQHKKLRAVKTLGEPVDDDDSATAWVQKLNLIQEEKEKAERREQMLAEMEEEIGVGDLIQESFDQQKQQTYTANDLKGLTVEHKTEGIAEGKEVVLTLKDAGVLDETDDVLVNVNLIETEKAVRNIDLRRKKPTYDPYEEMDSNEPLKPSVLKKYDEEIEGLKKENFELGEFGSVDTTRQREAEIVKQKLQSQALTLEQEPAKIASEYFTSDEMVQFRKPKKRKKVRRLKADDLLGMTAEKDDFEMRDHGTRQKKSDTETSLADEDLDPLIGSALQRTRRLLTEGRARSSGAAKVAQIIQKDVGNVKMDDTIDNAIILDKTAEFCRQLGDKNDDDTTLEDKQDEEKMDIQEHDLHEVLGGWTEVEVDAPREFEPKEEELYQEAEPDVSSGLSAALRMATKKGFIDTTKQKKDSSSVVHVYSDMHRDRDYERQKERERERDLSHARSMSFPEKKSYNPHINIEYIDDKGRELTPKEAFRHLSHKFHGRGSGKRKTEKRMKKLQEEHFMNKSSSVDTPLNTLAMLQSKQQKSQTPYILISGGSQSMLAPDLAKK